MNQQKQAARTQQLAFPMENGYSSKIEEGYHQIYPSQWSV